MAAHCLGSLVVLLLVVLTVGLPSGGTRSNDAYSQRNPPRAERVIQYQDQPSPADEPNPNQEAFPTRDLCAEACMVGCRTIAMGGKHIYLCSKLRPREKSLKERILSGASSWPWILFLSALILSFACCCGCLLWSCCCRRSSEAELDREEGKVGSSREPLATADGRRIEELIPSQQSRPLLLHTNGTRTAENLHHHHHHVADNSRPNNNGIEPHVKITTGSKYVADV